MAINLNVGGNTAPLEAAVQAAVNRIRKTPIKITVDDKGATQPLGNMKRGADEFTKSMEAANARIIAFGASMAIMNGVSDAFKAVVRNAVEIEKALADINVVMGLTASNLDKFSDGLFKVAKETGAAFNVAADAATEYARQGLGVEESLKRTRDALILTRLTGMDSAAGVKALTAAMNTYGKEIKDTTQLVSKFAAVDVKFAVSAEDFADAIARTGQAAKSAGVSIDELIGLVTAAQQQTARGGKVIGNSFKTIFTRIGRTNTLNQLENLGIAVRDLEGNTLGAKRILTDLANSFDHLSEAQKAQIAQTVGGVFQINILKAVLSDAAKQNGILANATQISAGATDEAIQKNEQLRQTMAAMATETGLALKDVSAKVGEIMLGPGIEKILNVVKSLADGANNLLGDGESAGGKFANGFLKGIGNIITGPGLVVITVVFGKLFLKAAQFAKESLVSLIGVTSEAQKQKAIQSSLVALFGRSAALSKEMLSTSTTKAQKEQTILALLKSQVAEAQMLDSIAKRAASTLYKQGYNASLAPRRGRASGYIPNFAHPERQEAAQGGYAAGNIRSMNMPGEGSVIYNSAEKVKNFAGFKQPAIMPPQSSKAGQNYQQAFGSVHGFDPYASGGYIPNFNKSAAVAKKPLKGRAIIDRILADGQIDLNNGEVAGNLAQGLGVLLGTGKEGFEPKKYTQAYSSLSKSKNLLAGTSQHKLVRAIAAKAGMPKEEGRVHQEILQRNPSVTANLHTGSVLPVSQKDIDELGEEAGGMKAIKEMVDAPLNQAVKKIAQKISKPFQPKDRSILMPGDIWTQNSQKSKANDVIGTIGEMAIRGGLNAIIPKVGGHLQGADAGGAAGAAFDFTGSHAGAINEFFGGKKNLSAYEMKLRASTATGKSGGIPKKVINYKLAGGGYIPNFSLMTVEEREALRKANTKDAKKRIKKFGNSSFSIGDGFYNDSPLIRVADPKTGTTTDFAYAKEYGERGRQASIIYSSRAKGVGVDDPNAKGGAFRNFGLISDFTSKQGKNKSIYSDFDQVRGAAGKTPWAMMLHAFPQLKQRIRPGMQTSGTFSIGMDDMNFNSLLSLKKRTNLWVKRNGLEDFIGYATANLGLNERSGMIGGTGSGEYFALSGLRSAILNRKDKRYLQDSKVGFKAGGYIPNFADPLSDAIGRERGAGVPVSQIRVGTHQSLIGRGNPLGIGVTNTTDEPNGLRDVFGANGYVPNYFISKMRDRIANSSFGRSFSEGADPTKMPNYEALTESIENLTKNQNEQTKDVKKLRKQLHEEQRQGKSNLKTKKDLDAAEKKLARTTTRIETKTSQRATEARSAGGSGAGGHLGRASGRLGRMFSGNAGMMMMMGAPMAAGFLQDAGGGMGAEGGNQTMYAAGGALTGAASGAMMASMIAPMFGPGAPLVIGIGGLIGGIQGLRSANEENTKALKEVEKERKQKVISSFMGSDADFMQRFSKNVFGGLNEDEMRVMSKAGPKFTANPAPAAMNKDSSWYHRSFDNPIANLKIPFISDLFRPNDQERKEAREYHDQIEKQNDFQKSREYQVGTMRNSLAKMGDQKFSFQNYKKNKQGKIVADGTPELKKASEHLKNLDAVGFFDWKNTTDTARIETLRAKLYEIFQQDIVNQEKQSQGLILQLNFQRVALKAQKAAADIQLDIKNQYFRQYSVLEYQQKILGGLMGEEQKARLEYNKNLLKASEAYASGAAKAEADFSMGIITDIQGQGKESLRSAVKQELFARMSSEERTAQKLESAGDISSVQLSSKLAAMSAKEREDLLRSIKGHEKDVTEILGNRQLMYSNQIDTLGKQKEFSEAQADQEAHLNILLGKRKDALKDINQQMDLYLDKIKHGAELRGIQSEIQSARFSSGPARSVSETFANDRRLMGGRQEGFRESYQSSGSSLIKTAADRMDLTKEERLQVLNDPTKLKGFQAKRISALQKEFELEAGGDIGFKSTKERLKDESDLLQAGKTFFEGKVVAEKYGNGKGEVRREDLEARQAQLKKDLDNLKQMEVLSNSLNSAKKEEKEDIEKITTELDRQLEITNKRINKEEVLQKIKEREYARITGPGAFSEGIKDGMTEMRKDTDLITHKLGKQMPAMLQDGLAKAMGAAINGAEDLGDVLRGVAMGFLQAIQQAMLQKAAGHVMDGIGGALGFSRGGQVPAMVTNGEYVMSRDAVNKYGGGFMHSLNARGRIPTYSNGGAHKESAIGMNFSGAEGYATGSRYQSQKMSGFFYSGAAENNLLGEDANYTQGIIQERLRKAAEKKAKKRALMQMIVGTALSVGLSAGLGNLAQGKGLFGGGSEVAMDGGGDLLNTADLRYMNMSQSQAAGLDLKTTFGSKAASFWGFGASRTGDTFAQGGFVSGKSGIDQIPAMLSEGEYVIKASSARQLGGPTLDAINNGRFNDGGSVTPISEKTESGISGTSTNNISISINVDKSGSTSESSSKESKDPKEASAGQEREQALAEKVKQQVVAVIIDEKRPGGLLSES